ncbi:MAG: FKBP-type peptidyl-prolyl cis-trans isomerase N-terminal domain-containing protein, partial [Syntrophales bacterium]|nr:FKBP-type peptidyl-prolyl cis-trans isomerase N-terminal domain-containing protein [Syntrophales bacterium]
MMTARSMGRWMAVLGVLLLTAPAGAAEKMSLETQKDKISYGIGVGVARNLKSQEIQVDLDAVMQGMKDTLSGGKLLMTETDLQKTMADFQAGLNQK